MTRKMSIILQDQRMMLIWHLSRILRFTHITLRKLI